MPRYNRSNPICSDEELLEELNKLGYDDVPQDVFNKMKDDLSELVEKEQDILELDENEQSNDPVSEYEYSDISPLSSKLLSTSDDCHATEKATKKLNSNMSRKVKKKSQKTSSRMLNNRDDTFGQQSNMPQNTDDGQLLKSSFTSLEYGSMYDDDDVIAGLSSPQDKNDNVNSLKTNSNTVSRNLRSDHNRNKDIRSTSTFKHFSPKDSDTEISYSSGNNRLILDQDFAVTKYKSKSTKENKSKNSWGKSDYAYGKSDTQNTVNDSSLKNVKDAFKHEKRYTESTDSLLNSFKSQDLNLNTSSSSSSERKTIKRKVLRRRNGRSIITEELVEIPSIFDTSYPESENLSGSKSFSSDDLSFKSNNSTGSVTAISPESSLKSSPSMFSLSSRSTSFRISSTRKKKSDPVAMYSYYKKFWDSFKPPGENTHDRLRWAVRDKMLEYNI